MNASGTNLFDRQTINLDSTLDGNFKANLFFKRDDGSDTALTDGLMYFPKQAEFDHISATYVIPEEDKVLCCLQYTVSSLIPITGSAV